MPKATRDTVAVLPTYAWTMLTPSYVTSNLVKNCPRANAISGALLQRNKIPDFLHSLYDIGYDVGYDVGFFNKPHFSSSSG
jgi:hypothetical protein